MRYISIVFIVISLLSCKKDCITSEKCQAVIDPCFGSPKYYYDIEEKRCKEFIYDPKCADIVPFQTLEECKQCECK